MKLKNSKGNVYYGMHFYPGVAEYREPGKDPFRIFINEDTIRKMNPSFAGRPVFVEHVEEVDESVDELRKEADGWVVESFFNSADGKHWVKFIAVSERAERAIQKGYRLSNAYLPQLSGNGGQWNGVNYSSEVVGGEHEHLAIVNNPRYEESVIMTPDEFKAYNEQQTLELKRLANSKEKENETMKLNLFKKTKVENSTDLEGMSVTLPKSGKEKTLVQLVNEADDAEQKKGLANVSDKVKVGEAEMTVEELIKKYGEVCNELETLKKADNDDDESLDNDESEADADADLDAESVDNEDAGEDEDAKKKALQLVEHEEKEILEKKKSNSKSKIEGKKNFDKLKNAHKNSSHETVTIDLMEDQLARGKARYGSN